MLGKFVGTIVVFLCTCIVCTLYHMKVHVQVLDVHTKCAKCARGECARLYLSPLTARGPPHVAGGRWPHLLKKESMFMYIM